MRFSLRALLSTVCLIGAMLGIAVWHPLLAGLFATLAVPLAVVFITYWRQPFAMMVFAAFGALVFVDLAGVSHSKTPQMQFKPAETNYHLAVDKGRLLAFRFEPWPGPLSTRLFTDRAMPQDWTASTNFAIQKPHLSFAGSEYAAGEYSAFFIPLMRHRTIDFSMVGLPIWLIALLVMAASISRLMVLRPWVKWRRGVSHTEVHRDGDDYIVSVFPKRPDQNMRLAALVAFALSILLLLVAFGLEMSLRNAAAPLPFSLAVWTAGLAAIQVAAGYFVDIPLRRPFRQAVSICRYLVAGSLAIVAALEVLLTRAQIVGVALEEIPTDLTGVRVGLSLSLCLVTLFGSRIAAARTPGEVMFEMNEKASQSQARA
jgi:hypothetical protein